MVDKLSGRAEGAFPEDHQAKRDDVDLAYLLLGGYEVTEDGELPQTIYLNDKPPYHSEDPSREVQARMAIARLLRAPGPLDRQLRDMLAALFDPEPDTGPGGERRLIFTPPRKNSIGPQARARTVVANEMYWLIHQEKMSREEAAEKVAKRYKSRQRTRGGKPMSAESVIKAWDRLKHLIELVPPKRPSER